MRLFLYNLLFLLCSASCAAGKTPGYVTAGKNCPGYFELDGRGWLPVSINYLPADGNGDDDDEPEFAEIEEYFRNFARNGINAIRVWISGDFLEIEHEAEGVYDSARFRRIDRFLELAAKYEIRVKFTLQHIRFISPERTRRDGWATSTALSTSFGGIDEYVTTRRGRQSYYNRAKALADRYADNPDIYAWELWNEMDAAAWKDAGWLGFTEEMLPRIQALFPNHLVMQTLGSLDTEGAERSYRKLFDIESNKFVAVHRYLDRADRTYDEVKGDIDDLVRSAVDFAREYVLDRPVVINEIGAVEPNHSGPSRLYLRDTVGMLLHDMVFAPFFCGAAGSGSMWHWDHYIRRNGLWCHFKRFARATKGIDLQSECFTNFVYDAGDLRFYGLKGRTQTLIWCRNRVDNWQRELADGKMPEVVRNVRVCVDDLIPGANYAKVEFYAPWSNAKMKARVKKGMIVLPVVGRSLVIKLFY
ncbi:hypothetical protein [Alistipes sp.]|uniref:hypothetical protein n=1 Tax=Alistipes sp. TaxID=1872444 RepID=UPI003AEF821B